MKFAVVFASAADGAFGSGRKLPWKPIRADMRHFRNITTGATKAQGQPVVIMGRRTWESLPPRARPLSGRMNIVVTRKPGSIRGGHVADSLETALQMAGLFCRGGQVSVIGGAKLIERAMAHPDCAEVYHTLVRGEHNSDVQVNLEALDKYFALDVSLSAPVCTLRRLVRRR